MDSVNYNINVDSQEAYTTDNIIKTTAKRNNNCRRDDEEDEDEVEHINYQHDSDIITTGRYSIDGINNNRRGHKFSRRKKSTMVTRGMDFIKKMRWKSTDQSQNNSNNNNGGLGARRLSTPNIDQTEDYMNWKSSWSTHNTPRASVDDVSIPEGLIMSTSTSSQTIGLPPIHENHQSAQYSRALHTPTRFLPQNQAVLTTTVDGKILLFNDIASLCFGIDKSYIGNSILTTLLEDPFRRQITTILNRRKKLPPQPLSEKGLVLVCGTIIPIVKAANGSKSVASLWLKEKKSDQNENIYIWIFEEIYDTSLSVYVDSDCIIRRVLGTMIEIYGYQEKDIIGQHVNCLVPALRTNSEKNQRNDNLERIDRLKFFGSQSSQGIYFPVIISLNRHVAIGDDDLASFVMKITSLPSISGYMTINRTNNAITALDPVPAKYLFGYSVSTIVEEKKYRDLIPHLDTLIHSLIEKGYLTQQAPIVYNSTCKKLLKEMYGEDSIIYVVHRDGSQFEVELQLKYIDRDTFNVWIKYDRIDAVSKYEKRMKREIAHGGFTKLSLEEKKVKQRIGQIISDNGDQDLLISPITEKNGNVGQLRRPIVLPSRISSFGAVDEHKKLFPTAHSLLPPSPPSVLDTNAEKRHPLDDYVILDILGQGTYGMAKLAYRKDDPSQKKLVIKYIIKSKIIVDSWIRDRQIGLIPMEIHILQTLQKYPHRNCCRLVTSLEDEDYYFVVMELLGDGMDLFDYIEINKDMKEDEIKRIFYQVACAVKHLHQHRIVHRDIKDENIILDAEGTVHLIDFGCATYYKKDRKFDTFTGTLEYCAPEVLKGKPYEGPPQDIWASGILLFTLIYRENPFYNIDEIMERQLRVPYVASEGSLDLIKKMLERDVDKRINIDGVLAHPWFHSITTNSTN